MIDDYPKAMALIRAMKAQLPIPARPTNELVAGTSKQGKAIFRRDQQLEIRSVLYGGDEGGILCDVTPPGSTVVLCSLTHVIVDPDHPLTGEIRAYQVTRARKLAGTQKPGKPARFTARPRKKRRR